MINTDNSGDPCERGWSSGHNNSNLPEENRHGKGAWKPNVFKVFPVLLVVLQEKTMNCALPQEKTYDICSSLLMGRKDSGSQVVMTIEQGH